MWLTWPRSIPMYPGWMQTRLLPTLCTRWITSINSNWWKQLCWTERALYLFTWFRDELVNARLVSDWHKSFPTRGHRAQEGIISFWKANHGVFVMQECFVFLNFKLSSVCWNKHKMFVSVPFKKSIAQLGILLPQLRNWMSRAGKVFISFCLLEPFLYPTDRTPNKNIDPGKQLVAANFESILANGSTIV